MNRLHLIALIGIGANLLLAGLSGCTTRTAYREFESSEIAIQLAGDQPHGDLRVMSANVRHAFPHDVPNLWEARRDLLVKAIRNFDPDIMGTQEPVLSQTKWLAGQLSEYEWVGRGRGRGEASSEMSVIFFKRDRFEVLESGEFWYSRTPEKPGTGSWGAWVPRMCNWVKLREKTGTGRELYVFNTHFEAFSSNSRIHSAQLLRSRIADIAGSSPVIVTGDFNSDPSDKPYRFMTAPLAGVTLRDTYRIARPQSGADEKTYHAFTGGDRGTRIDWILTCDNFRTLAAGIDRTHQGLIYPSDHYPVTAILSWSGNRDVILTSAARPDTSTISQ